VGGGGIVQQILSPIVLGLGGEKPFSSTRGSLRSNATGVRLMARERSGRDEIWITFQDRIAKKRVGRRSKGNRSISLSEITVVRGEENKTADKIKKI